MTQKVNNKTVKMKLFRFNDYDGLELVHYTCSITVTILPHKSSSM